MITSFICGAAAVLNSCLNIGIVAAKSKLPEKAPGYKDEEWYFIPAEKPTHEEEEHHYIDIPMKNWHEVCEEYRVKTAKKPTLTFFEVWVKNHCDDLLRVMSSPSEYKILPKGMYPEKIKVQLKDYLFKLPNIASVEETDGGIVFTMSGKEL